MSRSVTYVLISRGRSLSLPTIIDQPDDIVLVFLRQMDAKLDRLVGDMQDTKGRLTSLEKQVALLHGDFAGQPARIDSIDLRLERIERRLELTPVLPQS